MILVVTSLATSQVDNQNIIEKQEILFERNQPPKLEFSELQDFGPPKCMTYWPTSAEAKKWQDKPTPSPKTRRRRRRRR